MLPDQVSNPGPLTYESGALPIALRGPAVYNVRIKTLTISPRPFMKNVYAFIINQVGAH